MIDGEFRDRVHDPHDISHGLAITESGETVKVVVVNDGLWVARGRHVCSVQNPAAGDTVPPTALYITPYALIEPRKRQGCNPF
jgi:hypothetical protein